MQTRTTIEVCPQCGSTDINDFGNCDEHKLTRVWRDKTETEIKEYDEAQIKRKAAIESIKKCAAKLNW